MKEKYFKDEHNKLTNQLRQLEKKAGILSLMRLISFLMALLALLAGYFKAINWLMGIAIIFIVIFFILVIYYHRLVKQINYLQARLIVIKRYLARFNSDWKEFEETGTTLIENSWVIKDLDLVGQNSLFQYLNTAKSLKGKQRLLNKLTRKQFNYQQIILEQEAIDELSKQKEFDIIVETYGYMVKEYSRSEKAISDFIDVMKQSSDHQWFKLFSYLLPIVEMISLLVFCFEIETRFSITIFGLLFLIQLIINIIMMPANQKLFECSGKLMSSLDYYLQVCKLTGDMEFKSAHLFTIKQQLQIANERLNNLKHLSSMIKQRNNLLAFLLLNGLFSYDYHCQLRLNQWIKINGSQLDSWLNTIGELESLVSLQVLYQTKDNVCKPMIKADDKPVLSFQNLKHPLLVEQDAIANSFTMDHQVCVITGSNMSGKTTFLRTIGINLVLAYAGGFVLGDLFTCSLMEIFTSMRIEDDIEGISTFYGELLRIKEMVQANQKQTLMIALIDEIFRGTNSNDRIIGAIETVKRLATPNIFTLITTHDKELCNLPQEISCANYHFEEYYQDNKIKFDYLIKPGPSQTTNARYLLKMVGIID